MACRTQFEMSDNRLRRRVAVSCWRTAMRVVVAMGLVWSGGVALLAMKNPWFYAYGYRRFVQWLSPELREEAEAILVVSGIVVPFIATGFVFNLTRPTATKSPSSSSIVHVLRRMRRCICGGRFDSVDLVAILLFVVAQGSLLAGKLLIDNYTGKLPRAGLFLCTGSALGLNGFYAVLLSVVLVARRSFVHEYMQLSTERSAKYHIWLANFGVLALLGHTSVYIVWWFMHGTLAESLIPCFNCDATRVYKSLRNFSGLVAEIIFVVVALFSLERVRRRHFRRFTFVHCLNAISVVATCVHYYPAIYWFIAPGLVYLIYRVMSWFTRTRSRVVHARALDDAIVQLHIRREGDFLPGQYVYIKVDEIGRNEWHPMTISSSPLRDSSVLSLDIKVQGQFTERLWELVNRGALSSVQIDGYYGTEIEVTSHMVLIAGGSGMTPFLSLLEHLMLSSRRSTSSFPRRLWVVWTARDLSLLEAHKALLEQFRRNFNCQSCFWLHWTGSGIVLDIDKRDIAPAKQVPNVEMVNAPVRRPLTSFVFLGAVIGSALGVLLVFHSTLFSTIWWVKRLSLLVGYVFGVVLGATIVVWRPRPRRAGYEWVEGSTEESLSCGLSPPRESFQHSESSLTISRSRPNVEGILREIHASCFGQTEVRVVVCGPKELQQCVGNTSAKFRSPLLSVESRSFSL